MTLSRFGYFAAVLVLVSSCGNARLIEDRRTQIADGFSAREQPTLSEQRALIPYVLENTEGPILLVEQPGRDQGAFFAFAAENDGVQTFGSDSQLTVSLRGPVIVQTRALGDDMMSSDVGRLPALLSAREPGRYTRVMRYLNGLGQTVERTFDCALTIEDQRFVEYCGAADYEFTNHYADAGNEITVADQWISDGVGVLRVRRLR